VFSFILTGTLIIFLTFLTTNNAIEIAISGIASVFIVIGVNNFSSIETIQRDLQKQKHKDKHLLSIPELVNEKSKRIQSETPEKMNKSREAEELVKLTGIAILLLNERT
jgi:aspartyl/asparaginyl beta-hydroxylase (cupin superfamily)